TRHMRNDGFVLQRCCDIWSPTSDVARSSRAAFFLITTAATSARPARRATNMSVNRRFEFQPREQAHHTLTESDHMLNAVSYRWSFIAPCALMAALGSAITATAQTVTGQAKASQTIEFGSLGGSAKTT